MLHPYSVIVDAFAKELSTRYRQVFGHREERYGAIIESVARLSLERIAGSDAPYHDVLHTVFVTDVGQAILRGRLMGEHLEPVDWLHFTAATLLHDIGFLRGACPGDGNGRYVIDTAGKTIEAPRGATDAFLGPWHVERGKIFVRHRMAAVPDLDAERLAHAIELTRFPVPQDGDHDATEDEAGLVRAADLIGQLGDPAYKRKLAALYHELREIGVAERLGYNDPADVAELYPQFFWRQVEPYIGAGLGHLERTAEGRLWVAQLYAHVFVEEHARQRLGPERGGGTKATKAT